jgi:hypothetical protein
MILALVKACQDQINRSQLIGLGNSTVLGEFLACPARFERATYALEAGKMRLNNSRNNGFKVFRSDVQ